jgi:hypothetical protein
MTARNEVFGTLNQAEAARRLLNQRGYTVSTPYWDQYQNWCLTILVWGA